MSQLKTSAEIHDIRVEISIEQESWEVGDPGYTDESVNKLWDAAHLSQDLENLGFNLNDSFEWSYGRTSAWFSVDLSPDLSARIQKAAEVIHSLAKTYLIMEEK